MGTPFYKKKILMLISVPIVLMANSGLFLPKGCVLQVFTVVGVTSAMLFAATCLIWLKKEQQFWYGIIEVLFSIIAAVLPITKFYGNHGWDEMTFTEMLVRIALIYVIVRGINNVDDGLNKSFFLDTWIKKLWSKIRIRILE